MRPSHSLLAVVLLCGCSLSCRPPEPDGEAATDKRARQERAEAALDALSAADVNGTRMSILSITRMGERMDLKVRLVYGPHSRDLDFKGRAHLSVESYDDKGEQVGMYDYWTMRTNWERGPDHKSVYTCYFLVEVLPRATHVAVGHPPHYTKPVAIP
jgi:hypothetical protein